MPYFYFFLIIFSIYYPPLNSLPSSLNKTLSPLFSPISCPIIYDSNSPVSNKLYPLIFKHSSLILSFLIMYNFFTLQISQLLLSLQINDQENGLPVVSTHRSAHYFEVCACAVISCIERVLLLCYGCSWRHYVSWVWSDGLLQLSAAVEGAMSCGDIRYGCHGERERGEDCGRWFSLPGQRHVVLSLPQQEHSMVRGH